jgi:hypothetical protein
MSGVLKIEIVPRKSGDQANQRVFVLTTDGAAPDEAALKLALGRRAERYPILSLTPSAPVPPAAPRTLP